MRAKIYIQTVSVFAIIQHTLGYSLFSEKDVEIFVQSPLGQSHSLCQFCHHISSSINQFDLKVSGYG